MPASNKRLPKIDHPGRPIKHAPTRRPLATSGLQDVARAQPVWPPVAPPRPVGVRGYSTAMEAVLQGPPPKKNSVYA